MSRVIDYAWGRPSVDALKRAGAVAVVRYLSHDNTGKNLTPDEAKTLRAGGIDIVSNWEYAASEALAGYAEGATHARLAHAQAVACGMPASRPIYFSVDWDETPAQAAAVASYFDGIASVIGRGRTGAYGGYWVIKRLFDAGKITYGWQTYAWSGGQWDPRAQLRQVLNGVTVGGVDCDLNDSMAADFGQWGGGDMANLEATERCAWNADQYLWRIALLQEDISVRVTDGSTATSVVEPGGVEFVKAIKEIRANAAKAAAGTAVTLTDADQAAIAQQAAAAVSAELAELRQQVTDLAELVAMLAKAERLSAQAEVAALPES